MAQKKGKYLNERYHAGASHIKIPHTGNSAFSEDTKAKVASVKVASTKEEGC